ncbi:MAG: GLUG motif-containing protein, partial [Nanoarchaeota archaeon]|nr:GLUG motif-containing protein [Nanoarchaeota archaeon]
WNNGKGFEPIGNLSNKFTGSFNGQNYKIKNLYINRGNEDNIGLFGAVESTNEIKSVGLENSYIIGKNYVGSLIGSLIRGIIDEIYSKDIAVQGYGNEIGGLIGKNENGTIKNTFTTGTVAGNIYVGGLTGFNNGTIENSYSTSDLNGRIFLGGLVGYNYKNGTIKNSFSTGKAPGFVNYNKGSITNSYGYNYTKCAYNNYGSSDCIIKNNKSYFYSKNNQPMTDWDFVNIWKETTNNFIILKNLCKSKVCSELGKECGSWNDGCEKMIDCGACSSGNCISGKCIQKCSDSDGGNNIYVKGTTTGYDTNGNLITREDSCSSRLNRVIEYYCSTTG